MVVNLMWGTVKRVLAESVCLSQSEIPHSLRLRGGSDTYQELQEKLTGEEKNALAKAVLVPSTANVVIYLVLELPPILWGSSDHAKGLFAFFISKHFPFSAPRIFLLTRGVFVPSAGPAGRGRGPTPLRKVAVLGSEWSPACRLTKVLELVLSEIADSSQWAKYLREEERDGEMLQALLMSSEPEALKETIKRFSGPIELRNLGSHFSRWAKSAPRNLSEESLDTVVAFLDDPVRMLMRENTKC